MEHHLAHQKCAVSITGQGTDLGCGFDPQSLTWMFLSLSPSLSLKSINIYPQVRFSFFLIKRRNLILFMLYTLFSFFILTVLKFSLLYLKFNCLGKTSHTRKCGYLGSIRKAPPWVEWGRGYQERNGHPTFKPQL